MKLLLDSCVAPAIVNHLQGLGHNVAWIGEREADPGDDEIIAEAFAERRLLTTLDKDFGELAVVFGMPHAGIVRMTNMQVDDQSAAIERVLNTHKDTLVAGAIITVGPGRLRIRLPDA